MRLKEVEIIGFKSFMGKTNVKFEDGITAIVGPNGSGKSNISDGIRWALGEQSVKSLRGNSMADVIFAGTDKRKALGYCEVTVIFDNQSGVIPIDYDEVAITRRVFRSGESEYYINKNACRLKDIRELIMDTGIGREGYSIIGQGKIEEILSSRPEDRRGIFEEAAGIVKYKTKKIESERKLNRTKENLMRIEDIVMELSRREKDLKRQSDRALEYKEVYSKLKGLEINLLVHEIEDSKDRLKVKREDLKENQEKLDSVQAKINTKTRNINRTREELSKNQKRLDFINEKKIEIINDKNTKINRLTMLEEKEKYNERDSKRLSRELIEFSSKEEELLKENEALKMKLIEEEDNLKDIKEKFKIEETEFTKKMEEIKDIEKDLEGKNHKQIDYYNKISDYKSEINSINSLKNNIDERKKNLESIIEELKTNIESTESEHKIEESKIAEEKDLIEKYNKSLEKMIDKNKSDEDKYQGLEEVINKLNIQIESNISNHRLYKNMEESYEGYYRGVRSILKAADKNPDIDRNIVGVVSDLIKVDEEFTLAISTALGGRAQNIVTKNQNGAKRIIDYLRNNRLGRVTCLPHNIIRGNTLSLSDDVRKEFNVAGLGSELVEYDRVNKNIVENLLGRVAIVPNMDDGVRLSNRFNNSIRIVTQKGEVINPGGSMTGGSQSNSSNIFSRKNKIVELEEEIEKNKKILEEYSSDKIKLRDEIFESKAEIEEIKEKQQKKEYELLNLKNQYQNKKNDLNRYKDEIKKNFKDLERLDKENKTLDDRDGLLKDELVKLEKSLEDLKKDISKITEKSNELKEKRDEMNYRSTENRLLLDRKNNEILESKNKILDNEKTIEDLKVNSIENKETIKNIEEESIESREERSSLGKEIERLELLEKDILLESNEILEDNNSKRKIVREAEEVINKYNVERDRLVEERNAKELKHAKEGMNIQSYFESLRENYDLNYKGAMEYKEDEIDMKKSREEVKILRSSIRRLGNVNMDSIEEYEELYERLSFIYKQQEDLNKAKKDLYSVIGEMEKKMHVKFMESFEIINENFKEVFKILFKGGEAELVLCDKDDILNTGIDIEVEPPGKKLQNLTLLSGGEKSLTAVALLFAILKMKPSPFCILDEIDAALDEANIGRYTSYLQSISEDTQFIIITHRKRTMEMADTLYGVTMQEEGISKLLSIELKDFDEIEDIVS